MLTQFALILVTVSTVSAGLTNDIQNVTAMRRTDFIPAKVAGLWYQQQQYALLHEATWKCITDRHFVTKGGDIIVTNTGINTENNTREQNKYLAMKAVDDDKALYITHNIDESLGEQNMEVQVVNTDYNCFWIAYGQLGVGGLFFQGAWVITRDRYPSPSCQYAIDRALEESGLDQDLLEKTDQINCPPDH